MVVVAVLSFSSWFYCHVGKMVTAAVDACLCHVGCCRQVRELDNIPPTAELRKGFLQVVRGVVTHSADYRTHRHATLETPIAAFFR